MRLKYSEIADYRTQQLTNQSMCCALCGEVIDNDAVLDHDHKTGLLRQVLHRGCNALLGKIENNMPRNKITLSRLEGIAHNLINYLTQQHTEIIHPKHKERKNANTSSKRSQGRKRVSIRKTRKSVSNKSTSN